MCTSVLRGVWTNICIHITKNRLIRVRDSEIFNQKHTSLGKIWFPVPRWRNWISSRNNVIRSVQTMVLQQGGDSLFKGLFHPSPFPSSETIAGKRNHPVIREALILCFPPVRKRKKCPEVVWLAMGKGQKHPGGIFYSSLGKSNAL